MNKTAAVVYKTKYGSSKTYAGWIAEETGSDLFAYKKVRLKDLMNYDIVVYLGSLYAGGMLGVSLISKNMDQLPDKKIVLCSVGASFGEEHNIENIKDENFSQEMLESPNIHYFHLQGSLDYKKMSLFHRILMRLLFLKVKNMKPEERDKDAQGIIGTYGKTVDMTRKKNIEPVVECIKKLKE